MYKAPKMIRCQWTQYAICCVARAWRRQNFIFCWQCISVRFLLTTNLTQLL